ncbi:glycosyltransferase family 39 protein [Gordonia sp. Z-3]|uniref:Glycosyltransferase family 39 protein n=1 Tax=Gordonia aquimaris TaxID=2984863 RepID=A0A9X3I3W4_9ACTN|nr:MULTISPECIES: glycosyltransferase family 39 protein [Gordonia]MCX2963345.1 glycosyltransferase family 39 protein [Gordonia aquimaris]MED5800543.1 glycosyltransferase family 39 protein [Gordonia sp. Z-3]
MTAVVDAHSAAPVPPDAPASGRNAPVWQRLSLVALLLGTAIAYLANLSANGWANSFYSAAIQAGSESWKAWFFGSSDMANSITVDKPPASLWIPGISVRIFGLNSWSILVPEVLMGVASVALLYLITKKYFGHWPGILAGLVLAVTPVAAMMFRFDNPEALLLLLMIAAVWATLKAVEDGRLRWMVLTGVFVGFGFLTKQLQVMLIVPPLAITYLAFGQHTWVKRIGHLFAALGAMIVSAGWWILAVELWPASSRPWIGGSQNNSILELTLGYNGFGRLNGNETGSVVPGGRGGGYTGAMGGPAGYVGAGGPPGGGPGGGGGMWGQTGWLRMFEPAQGGQIAWLIPTGIVLGIAALVLIGKARRTDARRAYLAVWGLWLLVTMAVFSFMAGIFHSYYTAALAPAVAAVVAGGAAVCWSQRDRLWVRIVLAAAVWIAAIWGFVLLNRSPDFVPWLRWMVLLVGLVSGVVMLLAHRTYLSAVAAITALAAGLAGPIAYTVDTIATPKQGSIISAGPRVEGEFGPGGGGPGGRGGGGRDGARGGAAGAPWMTPGGNAGANGAGPAMPADGGFPGMAGPGMMGPEAGTGGPGGLLNGSTPSAELVAMLRTDADSYTWVGAAVGSNEASGYQLESGYSVMPIGGFNGTDPSPTLEQFQKLVSDGQIHYFLGGGRGFGMSDESQPSAQIAQWVADNFTAETVDGTTVYDLTAPTE